MLPEYLNDAGGINLLNVLPLQLSFKTPLETCTFHEEQGTGLYEPMRDGDPLTYAASSVNQSATNDSHTDSLAVYWCMERYGLLYTQGAGHIDVRP